MPIDVDLEVTKVTEKEFKRLAYEVTGMAFEVYADYGGLFVTELSLLARALPRKVIELRWIGPRTQVCIQRFRSEL